MSRFGKKRISLKLAPNLKRTDSDDSIDMNARFIDLLERGIIRPSDETIEVLANMFKVDKEMMLQSRDKYTFCTDSFNFESTTQDLSEHNQNVGDTLLMIEEESKEMGDCTLSNFNKGVSGLSKPYSLQEFKNKILSIGYKWNRNSQSNASVYHKMKVLKCSFEYDPLVFFQVEYNDSMMRLVVQSEYFSQASPLWGSLGHHQVEYVTEEFIPHNFKKKELVHFLWFSPLISRSQSFDILNKLQVNFKTLYLYDNQLEA